MRKVLVLFLAVVLLFSFIPFDVEGTSFVKDIDVFFGEYQLKVNEKKIINHKEPFLYEEELFVSLTDLAKGLEMGINISKDNVNLTSNGKLNFNADSAKESLVFQRGYEVLAKERLAERLEDEIYILSNGSPTDVSNSMKGDVKNIKVGFGGVSIYLDGKKLNLDTIPLKYGNDIFVSIDSIAPYLYITPSLSKDKTTVNIDANGILVKNSYFSTIDALLSSREGRNYLLDIQRAELEKKKYVLKDLKLPYKKITSIKSLEDYLNRNFNVVGELNVSFNVVKQSNWINLDINFPNTKNYLWSRLKRADVEQWIWNIYTAIVNLYDNNALISGVIRNPYYSYYSSSNWRNYVTFHTKDNDIYFDFSKSRLNMDTKIDPSYLVENLNTNLSKHNNINLSYEAKMSGDNLELMVYPSSNDFSKLNLYSKMGYLRLLNQRIRALYPDLAVDGKIVYPDHKIDLLEFHISENRIRSKELMEETMKYLNSSYGNFTYGYDGFSLDYSLYERDLKNFHLVVEGNFSIDDDKWIRAGEVGKQRLNSNVHNALSFIASLWDANVSTEALDKNGVMISEYQFFRENVSIVYATPTTGEILEGSKVYLYADTPGAKIYYTTDGSTPTTYSQLYDGMGIEITRNMDIKAFGYKDGLGSGPISTFNYIVIRDEGLSYGLSGLSISNGALSPGFTRDRNSYAVSVGKDVNSINITPSAALGVIKIDGDVVVSGQSKAIALNDGSNTITISVKETNKRERVYTITVNKESGGTIPVFQIENLRFSTLFDKLVFSGKISNSSVIDFSSYTVKLYTRTDNLIGSVEVSSSGEFSFPNMEITWFDKIAKFRYEVHNSTGKVLDGNLE